MGDLSQNGFAVFDADPRVLAWAKAAYDAALTATSDPAMRRAWLRHGETWFVGVDALPNAPDGSVGGVPLAGPWEDAVEPPAAWHAAQVSVVYEGYPKRDAGESEAAHWFRVTRCAAHVDGLHLENGRRIMREPHAFILGLPLNESDACPLVVWRGSHRVMRAGLADAMGAGTLGADVTDAYKTARAQVFEDCEQVEVQMQPGQAVLVHRHAVHGVAPWRDGMRMLPEGRMVAYFRPECADPNDWLLG